MTIFGYDLSRYDSIGDVQPAFDLLNVEDPGCSDKAHRAHALGIIWGLYSWVYPGDQGHSASRSKAMGDLLALDGIGQPPAGHWLDYEQTGVTPQDLVNAFSYGVAHLGVYTYLYIIASVAGTIGNRPLWLAYYPGSNDGIYHPEQIGDAKRWGAKLWQYSSTNGTLDRDVVVDEAWWHGWIGAHPAPPAAEDDDDMPTYITKKSDPNVGVWVTNWQTRRWVNTDEWAFASYVGAKLLPISDQWWDSIPVINAVAPPAPPSGGGGDSGLTQEEVDALSAIVRNELDKTKLST